MHIFPMSIAGKILVNSKVVNEHFLMRIELSPAFPQALPGQFVMIRDSAAQAPLLSRPMSIYAFERNRDSAFLEIFYRVAGEGTRNFSLFQSDHKVQILGPLGKGFTVDADCRRAILISGGIGISPLTFLAAHLEERRKNVPLEITAYVGARSADFLAGLERLAAHCPDIRICTDDGSTGYRGTVTDLFARDLPGYDAKDSRIYTCGPEGMMKRLAEVLRGRPLPCQVSVEERMACGLGACLGCAVPVRTDSGDVAYRRVCKDGPVFDISAMVWSF